MIILICKGCKSSKIEIHQSHLKCKECGKTGLLYDFSFAETRDVFDKLIESSTGIMMISRNENTDEV